ncbi:DivIVA domain-containing protein [Micromonospora sp. GCM10011542]|uniref:DivIVA domain-containing protein n=1 Tax=Micromonospora sp. GCM10011542 TaxID=3317337 RepID=UPI0036224FA3
MRKPTRTAAILFGLGVGAAVGPSLGSAAVWSGAAIAGLGVALSLVGTTERDLVEDRPVGGGEETGVAGDATTAVVTERRRGNQQRPTLSGLGTRVEQIIELAEEQADDHRAAARLEAERIVTAARREAEAILNRAHGQATGIRPDPSPIPPTRAPSADEGPSPHA